MCDVISPYVLSVVKLLLGPRQGCDERVSMPICPLAYLKDHTSKLREIFCTCQEWPPSPTTSQYVMYFTFCGWRVVSVHNGPCGAWLIGRVPCDSQGGRTGGRVMSTTAVFQLRVRSSLPSLLPLPWRSAFLANVNSRSRSLYAVARPSVVCLSVVCLSSVTFVRPAQALQIFFRQYFYGIRYLGHPLTSTENFMEIVQGEPLCRGS